MSIYIRVYLKPSVVEHSSYTEEVFEQHSMDGGTRSKSGLRRAGTAVSRIIELRAEGKLCVEWRPGEGTRNLPSWIPSEHVESVLLTSTFSCAKTRAVGRYVHLLPGGGTATGTLSRKAPELKALDLAKIDGSFLHALLLLVENTVTLEGAPAAVFDLYYLIRGGDILPAEDWDRAQEPRENQPRK